MSDVEMERKKKIEDWLKTRNVVQLVAHAQALFYTVNETKGGIEEVITGYFTPDGEERQITLHIKDHELVLLEMVNRVIALQDQVEELDNHILELGERD